jgi:catechol 2,3-dioxygenase-like lactoylglutathione lyase family enzyme
VKAAFRRLSENGENNSEPPLRRQPPAVYGEHGVVYVHLYRITSGAKNKRARHAAITQPPDPRGQRPAKASPSGTSCWGLRCTPAGIPGPISPAAICGSACRTTRRASTCRRRRATTPTTRLPWRKRILNRSRKLEQAGVTVWKQNKSEGASFYFLDPDGHKLELHGQPRRAAGGVSREALCGHGVYLRRGLRRTFSLPASVTCVAASS